LRPRNRRQLEKDRQKKCDLVCFHEFGEFGEAL